jgi:hypothetical protein
VFGGRWFQPAYVIGNVDVSWSPKIVAGDERRWKGAHTLVGNGCPCAAGEEERVAPRAGVARRHDRPGARPPSGQEPPDSPRGEVRPVCEAHDSRFGSRPERVEAAAKRGAGPALPLGAGDDAYTQVFVERVRSSHDDHLVDGTFRKPFEDARQ